MGGLIVLSSLYFFVIMFAEIKEGAALSNYLKCFATEEETMSTLHQETQVFQQLPKRFEKINRSGV